MDGLHALQIVGEDLHRSCEIIRSGANDTEGIGLADLVNVEKENCVQQGTAKHEALGQSS